MPFVKMPVQPAVRANPEAPGLKAGEVAVTLDNGDRIAVAVEPTWEPNTGGAMLKVCARWIKADGSDELDPDGKPVCTESSLGVTAQDIRDHTLEALMQDAARIALGEPTTVVRASGLPVLAVAETVKVHASVRSATRTVKQMRTAKLTL